MCAKKSKLKLSLTYTGLYMDAAEQIKGEHVPTSESENPLLGKFDQPLPCFGCGIGWFS